MKKLLLLSLSLLSACEILIPRVLPDECTVGSPATCDGSVLSICEDGILITLDCGDLVCNADTASCGACGDGVTSPSGETCDDGNTNNGDGCNANCIEEPTFNCTGSPSVCTTTCGDGDLDLEEECDDGNDIGTDACPTNCQNARCGDGFLLSGGEECDDANAAPNDGCSSLCVIEFCGDGFVNNTQDLNADGDTLDPGETEECDDGNDTTAPPNNDDATPNACRTNCLDAHCGDGILDNGEACDDGNNNDDDGCDATCGIELCGDGTINFDQTLGALDQCDDGNNIDGDGCDASCVIELCGDGIVNNTTEQCDDGNSNQFDGCTNFCRLGQQCDVNAVFSETARTIFDASTDTCYIEVASRTWNQAESFCSTVGGHLTEIETATENSFLAANFFGIHWIGYHDLITEAGATAANFQRASGGTIGAGFQSFAAGQPDNANNQDCVVFSGSTGVWSDENCDGTNIGIGLPPAPMCEVKLTAINTCGDGVLDRQLREECDDGNNINGDGCESNCALTNCGNGANNPGEACDDGNSANGDGCDNNCTISSCGNGAIDSTEQCDDSNTIDDDGCDSNCVIETCGDGVVNNTNEQCDDANTDEFDGCSNFCQFAPVLLCDASIIPGANAFSIFNNSRCFANVNSGRIWQDAENDCVAKGAHLAVVDSPEENAAMMLTVNTSGNTWIGYNDIVTEATTVAANFVKVTGGIIGTGFHNFAANKPDNGNANQDCVQIQNNVAGTWDDTDCTNNRAYVCEADVVFASSCGNGVLERDLGEECDDKNTLDGDSCASNCALPHCGDRSLNAREQCDDGNNVNDDGCDNNCMISACGNGSINAGEACDDGNAVPGDGCSESCVIELCGDGITNNNTEECDDGNNIDLDGCNNDCTNTCGPSNFPGSAAGTLDSNICYVRFATQRNWQNAENDCIAQGGHLSVIESAAENAIVQALTVAGANVWIGFNDLTTEANTTAANFVKVTGGTIGAGFQNFATNQPDNFNNQDCVFLFQNTGQWDDSFCVFTNSYVCELAP